MRFFAVIVLLLFTACDDAQKQPQKAQPIPTIIAKPESTMGYEAYIFACTSDGEEEIVCKCQAQILSRQLSDEKVLLLAEAGAAASQGDVSKIDEIMNHHPDILVVMKNLSVDAKLCTGGR